jgi:hypothetical protein
VLEFALVAAEEGPGTDALVSLARFAVFSGIFVFFSVMAAELVPLPGALYDCVGFDSAPFVTAVAP